ncbi:MAG TPA: sulfotransferase [Solirubrobacteraceae bacterium]|nr:sulfotransferase [Solirubrobacteraceae bacterium]
MTVPGQPRTSEVARPQMPAAENAQALENSPGAERVPGDSRRRMPDFFIVGHPKCGTTALHEMLRRHPQIHMPLKEPRFFAQELRSRFRRLGPETLPLTPEHYMALFDGAGPGQLLGEASPQYLRSQAVAERIARADPDARIIAILREPASFLRSFHLQALHNLNETETDFAKALALEPARREGRKIPLYSQSPQALMYSEHVRYAEQLRRFHEAFPAEQVLVLIYDDFRRDNAAVLRQVLRFLDVDETVAIEPVTTSQLPAMRSPRLYALTRALGIVRQKARRARGADGKDGGGRRLMAGARRSGSAAWRRVLFAPQAPVDQALMAALRVRFKPDVEAISEYLGRDLVHEWGYDELG